MKHWSQKNERGSAWLIHLITWLARTAGRPLCRVLLYPIVSYFVVTDRMAWRASREFLGAVNGRPARLSEVFAHIYSFAATLLDRVYMAASKLDRFEVAIEGLPLLDRVLQQGRGCVLLGSHLGSFDLMLAHRAMDGRSISVMMHVNPNSRLRRIVGIDDRALNLIELGRPDSFIRAYDALTKGGVVAVLADRVDGAACLPVRFMGRMTTLPIGPHVLAARSGAALLMCFGLYDGGNRYRIEFMECGSAAAGNSRGSQLQPQVDRYAALLEQYARRYPLNWFNFYPYWAVEKESN